MSTCMYGPLPARALARLGVAGWGSNFHSRHTIHTLYHQTTRMRQRGTLCMFACRVQLQI